MLGLIWEVENTRTGKGRTRTVARISDETGAIRCTWFNQPYLLKQLPRGAYIVITGVKQRFGNRVEFGVRSHELPEQGDLINTGRLVPVYALTEGLSPKVLRRFTKWAVDRCAPFVPEHLPRALRARAGLMPLPEAVAQMHYPDNEELLAEARRRLAFDELFLIQLGMLTRRANWQDGPPAPALPVPPALIFADAPDGGDARSRRRGCGAGAGRRAVAARRDVLRGDAALPLHGRAAAGDTRDPGRSARSAGDVPAAAGRCRLRQDGGGRGRAAGRRGQWLPGRAAGANGDPGRAALSRPERAAGAVWPACGAADGQPEAPRSARPPRERWRMGRRLAVGTHALIQEDVAFARLGLAVVDEQHRFGVEQRDALRQKGYNPHMLVMTATPIPRTLALTLYGDLDVSVLDEMPAGRQPIITRWRSGDAAAGGVPAGRRGGGGGAAGVHHLPAGRGVGDAGGEAAVAEYERLQTEVFPELRLGLVHGQLQAGEKDRVMRAFRDGEIDVLVATAVVEVGVDVPNATVMLIEDADRFGLSQLHQFRGRVGRGEQQSYCYLLSQEAGMAASERLSVMEQHHAMASRWPRRTCGCAAPATSSARARAACRS